MYFSLCCPRDAGDNFYLKTQSNKTHYFKVFYLLNIIKMSGNVKFFRFVGGFVCGAAVTTGSCVAVMKLYKDEDTEDQREPEKVPQAQQDIGRYGFPLTGAEIRYYANHTLSYNQAMKTPRWVAEHLSHEKLLGKADRKHCKFKPDPSIPEPFTAHNADYLGSGWSRGHMAPAGDNKTSEQSMAETFYLSNIVPQNYENNAGYWNRLEMYCRDLAKRFDDVWVISGPLVLSEEGADGKKTVSYQVIGKDDVAVPTHLFKVILVGKDQSASGNLTNNQSASITLALGAFVVPNQPIGFKRPLTDFQVSLSELEKISGLTFFPKVERTTPSLPNLCDRDSCQLMDFKDFTLYLTARKVGSARTTVKLEKSMAELKEQGIAPDDYVLKLYQEKKKELENKEHNLAHLP
ncbi:nuclease EXOG, mitochondrial isoform 1-T1 [Salvelinus alpinus]|uniref:nuclease EXOG, mitochondrial n=1 Tax=Salvelinus sp. IW2-2015 TaxID=2691554 RepID=UPI000CDFBEB0|nr:nuclease EXOG, mitochondrial [Salvelinus alpinus]